MALSALKPPVIAPGTSPNDPRHKAWKTASAFETQFVKSLLEQAMTGMDGEGPLGSSGPGAEAWRSLLIDEHAKAMTARGGLGLAPYVFRDMTLKAGGTLDAKA